jgi:hypothetical protein
MGKQQIQKWLNRNRPGRIAATMNGKKGTYDKKAGPAASFQAIGNTWSDVARHFGITEQKMKGDY